MVSNILLALVKLCNTTSQQIKKKTDKSEKYPVIHAIEIRISKIRHKSPMLHLLSLTT